MDTSETYIRQCDCEEIQAIRQWDEFSIRLYQGDCYAEDGIVKVETYGVYAGEQLLQDGGLHDNAKVIWLPRQDELQEMVSNEVTDYWELRSYPLTKRLERSEPFELLIYGKELIEVTGATIEQTLLKGLQKASHNKTWGGDKWV